ncbi:MAG: UPF0182 family protein [Actinomycetales bacterium]|nr:UPF0182 family protein [Actinomycetales bacterium]
MTQVPPSRDSRAESRGRAWAPTLAVVAALLLVGGVVVSMLTDYLWFSSVDATEVFTTTLLSKWGLFAAAGVLTSGVIYAASALAWRARPAFPPAGGQRYREVVEPIRVKLLIGASLFFGFFAGSAAAGQWQTVQLFLHRSPFGVKDPQFGRDVSYFMFTYPFQRFVVATALSLVVAALIASAVTFYAAGSINLQGGSGQRITVPAQRHLAVLAGLGLLIKAAAYRLDQFGLALRDSQLLTGLKYTDVHARIPALQIMMGVAALSALLFFVAAFRGGMRMAVLSLGLLAGVSLLAGGVYPSVVQQLQVKPSEVVREAPYIQRHIDATRYAYGLDDVKKQDYSAVGDPTAANLAEDTGTLNAVRLLDPNVMSTTFSQLQLIKNFYAFPDLLDIDRYTIDGKQRGVVLAVRDVNLNGLDPALRNWANDHVVYTHGFGLVAAFDNTADQAEGKPVFVESNLPPSGKLGVKQPRVYFGEFSPPYSIVGGTSAGKPVEFDYPTDATATGQANYAYTGTGGVSVGPLWKKLLFAAKYQDANILLSKLVTSDSRILWDRTPAQRVRKVAPWLQLDSDPYPAVVNGRITWILDGYTTSANFPYAAKTAFGEATADSLNTGGQFGFVQPKVNYIRNSVKATVDAYDGTVTLYSWDSKDPLLKAWQGVFPGVVKPSTQMAVQLVSHVRYPEDMFKVQREVLARFHVTDPAAFYSGQDFWVIPNDPTKENSQQAQPPYYLTVRMPGQKQAQFSLTTTFAPNQRPTLAAFMAVNSTPGPDYGTMRVLQLPRSTTIPGPTQAYNNFESDPTVSTKLSLLRAGGSQVDLGNLLSLPVGGGVLYVEPVYVRASKGNGFPVYRKVLVSYGTKVAFEDTLSQALAVVFEGAESAPTPTKPGQPKPPVAADAEAVLAKALNDAQAAYDAGQAALAKGDFAEYGVQQRRLAAAIKRAQAARAKLPGGTKTT